MMCAARDNGKKCHKLKDGEFSNVHATAADHYRGEMIEWEGYPLIVTGQSDSKVIPRQLSYLTLETFVTILFKGLHWNLRYLYQSMDETPIYKSYWKAFIFFHCQNGQNVVHFWWLRCPAPTRSLLYGRHILLETSPYSYGVRSKWSQECNNR